MKYRIMYAMIQLIKLNPKLKKILIIFATAALTFILVVGGLLTYGIVEGYQNVSLNVKDLQAKKIEINQLIKPGCMDEAKMFLNTQLWLEKPIGQNFAAIKTACLHQQELPQNQW